MDNNASGVVIIGAGHAGSAVAGFLRQYGYDGKVLLIGDEEHLPYNRPPLSKAWLKGEADAQSTALRPLSYYQDNGIALKLGASVTSIDREGSQVRLADGSSVNYTYLIIATGSRAIVPPIDGVELNGVQCLRSAADAERLKATLLPGKHIAVIGGGYIGLEVAASAIALGATATIFEREERLLARSASPALADYFANFQRSRNVTVKLGASVAAFMSKGAGVSGVRLSNGEEIACDLALLGVGALPNSELAEAAGIACERGILVDEYARTNDPAVFAIGDVTNRMLEPYGRRMRLESVANATEQAKQAASAICGREAPTAEVTWNWSDQFDLKFQVAGMPYDVAETIVRGDLENGKFAIFHLTDTGIVQQVEAINAPAEFMLGKKLIGNRTPVDKTRLADSSVAAKELLS